MKKVQYIATVTAVLLAIGLTPCEPATAQQVARENPSASARGTSEILSRLVTINIDSMYLKQAIDLVGSKASIRISYDQSVVESYTAPVTVHATKVPLGTVLDVILSGTMLKVVALPGDRLAVVTGVLRVKATQDTVLGRVVDGKTGGPVAGAMISVDDSSRAKSRDNGTFMIVGVSPGLHKLVVKRLGYRVASVPVTVREGASVAVTVTLTQSAAVLNEVVTTATGDRRRLEVGNAVGTIKADSIVPTTLIRNMSDLLQARVPGVVVVNTDGAVGAPSRIRLRGINSLALNNDPIIILDGVRLNAQSTVASLQTNVGSATMLPQMSNPSYASTNTQLAPSRLDDIDPNTIESIDVLRGPSASSLYGTDAANGVIVIKTKKGHVGSWHTTISGDNGTSSIPGKMPDMWWGWGSYNGGLQTSQCNLAIGGITVSGGGCFQDSVTHFNPQNNALMRTQGTGTSRSLNANISGGTQSLQQFISARVSSDVGMAKMSIAESRLISRLWSSPPPSWMIHPNTQQNIDGSSRTTFNVSQSSDISLTTTGLYRNVLNSGSGIQAVGGNFGASITDTLVFLPSEAQRTKVTSAEKRGALSATGDYRPIRWLSFNAVGGGDFGLRQDESNLRAQDCSLALILAQGQGATTCPSGRVTSRGETFLTTGNIGAHLSFNPTSWLNLQTAMGEQYSHTNFYSLQVGNSDVNSCPLAFGTTLLSPAPICLNSSLQQYNLMETRDEAATAGIFIEETINLLGFYYTLGVRRDVASAFGGETVKSPPNYPKFNFSYPLSEQSFFPKQSYVSSLRLRLAYGQSGNQASQTAVLNNYSLDQVLFGGSTNPIKSVLVNSLGNPNLRPEKGTEWEGGIDISFLENERLHAEVTMYRKFTRDAITQLTLAPSFGEDNLSQYFNLGNVENRGLELSLTAKILDTRLIGWDFSLNASKNSNKLVHKAASLNVNGPLNTQFREGYPLYGYWGLPVVSYTDLNNDGVLQQSEIKFGTQQFMGAPYPKAEITYSTSVTLWNGTVRVNANLNQITGETTQLLVGGNGGNYYPRAAVDPTSPIGEQAGYIQAVVNNNAYIGTSSSVRLNELSVTYNVPIGMVRQLRAQSLAITLAGRNVALWSSYAGKDPNVDTSGLFGDVTQDNALGTPQPRNWTLRFNLGL